MTKCLRVTESTPCKSNPDKILRASTTAMPPDDGGEADTMRAPMVIAHQRFTFDDLVGREIRQRSISRRWRAPPFTISPRDAAGIKALGSLVGDRLERDGQIGLFDDEAQFRHGTIGGQETPWPRSGERSMASRFVAQAALQTRIQRKTPRAPAGMAGCKTCPSTAACRTCVPNIRTPQARPGLPQPMSRWSRHWRPDYRPCPDTCRVWAAPGAFLACVQHGPRSHRPWRCSR